MRMSCNGCRVLRKGCSEDCSIRPCLQWINNPESQANATVFLAKFYGRAGLMNLINAGPDNLRPAIFRSLLYEACGRIVNPIYGSVGLIWSGNWQLCQAAVDAVLKGDPILQISSETDAGHSSVPPLHKELVSYDIRHISKDDPAPAHLPWGASAATFPAAHDLYKMNKASRNRFKRSAIRFTGIVGTGSAGHDSPEPEPASCHRYPVCDNLHWPQCYAVETWQPPSRASAPSQASQPYAAGRAAVSRGDSVAMLRDRGSRENDSDTSMVITSLHGADLGKANGQTAEGRDVELELTLALERVHHSHSPHSSSHVRSGHSPRRSAIRPTGAELPYRSCDRMTIDDWVAGTTRVDLGLDLPA